LTPAQAKRFLECIGLSFMNPREKRTTTQPGLGQVSGDPRSTAVRARATDDEVARKRTSEGPESGPPISAPPISGAPPSARQTRAIESQPPVVKEEVRKARETKPVNTKALAEPDRISITPSGGRDRRAPTIREEIRESGDVARPPVDRVESRRLPAFETPRPPSSGGRDAGRALRPIEGRPVDGNRPVSRPMETRKTPDEPSGRSASRVGARGPEGKPPSAKPPATRGLSSRPPASRPAASKPARPVASRQSIREDDVGAAVSGVADAVGSAGRQIPRIVRTKAEIAAAPIDHRAGFLLAHIDGVTSVQGLVDVAAMPENEVREILERLRRLGIVAIR